MNNKWLINNIDIWAVCKVAITKGSYLDILSPPIPRKRLEHDFIDANGAAVDTASALTYEPKRFNIKIVITGTSYVNYWANYNAFMALVNKPGAWTLKVADLGISINLLYEGLKCVSKPRSFRGGKIAVEYELSVFEPNPTIRTVDAV